MSLIWIGLGRTAFFVGPSEWDDNLYCDMAAIPRHSFEVANRYAHIWTLRLFNLLFDSRRESAATYANLVVVAMSWMGFFFGRRLGGTACGLLSAALMPLYPALLRYLTVPYPDPPMALWSGFGVLCALAAGDPASTRKRFLALLGSGLFCFLAVKSKETGLSVLPAVFVALWRNVGAVTDPEAIGRGRRPLLQVGRLHSAGLWLAGVFVGWLLLSLADWAFLNDFWWSWRWTSYFPKPGEPGGGGVVRDDLHYLDFLFSTQFLAFTLLGAAGAAEGARKNPAVGCTAVWSFSALAFSSLISCRYMGLQALDRYCVAMGVPLVILSAYWISTHWRRTTGWGSRFPLGWVVAAVVTFGVAGYGLALELTGRAGPYTSRFAFFMLPVALLVLFLAPWLAGGRGWVRLSLGLMVAVASAYSVKESRAYVQAKRQIMEPWVALAAAMDQTGHRLARWQLPGKPYAAFRIGRRCRALSKRPPGDTQVREIASLNEIRDNEWLFSSPEVAPQVQREGWAPFVRGAEQGGAFVVYRRASQVQP